MAITVKYDRPTSSQLAVDGTLPIDNRNMAYITHNLATVSGQITLDASYPANGYAVPNVKFGMSVLNGVLFEEPNGYSIMYNRSTDKIQVYSTAGTEVTAATNLSTLQPVYFEAKGLV